MATMEEDRQRALDEMRANAGQGRIANDPGRYNSTVAPAIQQGMGARAQSTASGWADRNAIISKAASQMLGGVGSALNSARQQDENEWLRKYREAQAKKGGSGRRSGGVGGGDDELTSTMPTPTSDAGEWDWLDDYMNDGAPAAPGVNGPAPVSYPSRAGAVAATGIGRPSRTPSRPSSTRPPSRYQMRNY
jgi:hypothetical protein